MDGNIKDTPPIVFVPGAADRGRWQTLRRRAGRRPQAGSTPASSRPGPSSTSGSPRPMPEGARRRSIPARAASRLRSAIDAATGPGRPTRGPATASRSPTSGDFEKDQAFSYGAWVKLPKAGADRLDHRPDGRPPTTTAAGTSGSRTDRVGTHIIHKWPDDALKVVARQAAEAGRVALTCFVTYDGSGKAAGRQDLHQRRAAGDRRRRPTRCKNTIRTDGPAQGRPAAQPSTARRTAIAQDLRIYDRALAPGEVGQLAWADPRRGARSRRRPASGRRRDEAAVRLVARASMDPASQELRGEAGGARSRKKPRSRRGARSPT